MNKNIDIVFNINGTIGQNIDVLINVTEEEFIKRLEEGRYITTLSRERGFVLDSENDFSRVGEVKYSESIDCDYLDYFSIS